MTLLNVMKKIMNRKMTFFFIAVILLWAKSYYAYLTEFNLGIQNDMQRFLLFLNPSSSALFFLGIALLFKGRKQYVIAIIIDLILTILLYANVVFYRFFNDFLTLPVIFQTKNFGEVSGSAQALMDPHDVIYFIDILILIALVVFKVVKPHERLQWRTVGSVFSAAIIFFAVNLALAEADRPELLKRAFDRNYLVKYLGVYNYTVYDLIQNARSSAQRAMADSSDVVDVANYTKSNYTEPNPKYFGKAKNANVIYISLESLQNFMIDYRLPDENGQMQYVMPFLHSLTTDDHTFYFKNFFHQTGQGKTSDAEFMMENSLFPLSQGSVFYTKAQNTYQAAPEILKSKGYTSAVFHGNYKSFWNRDVMYKSLGYDKFFDARYYDMAPENVINYGMEDKPYFKESMPLLKGLKQPFYTKFITLSNHFDFKLDPEDIDFPEGDYGDGVVNRYFQTAHYLDEALQQFFTDLKASGLYDNTVIVMYGDHYGISENHNKAMSKVMNQPITPFENAQLQRVPLFIHVPQVKSPGKPMETYGGEVDVRPTLMHLLGIDTKEYIEFGSDLLSEQHRQIVPFRNGDFVTPEYTSVKGSCYLNSTGEKVDNKQCATYDDIAKKELEMSDKVVTSDLLRFYKPKGFVPMDKSKIDYRREVQDKDMPASALIKYDPQQNTEKSTPKVGESVGE
ncbi:MAG: LTA synthase family protein [Tuberibacillus sp.]